MSTSDDREPPADREPIDLQKRRMARQLEEQLGGLFGIELPDIESAIQRLYNDFETGQYDERERMRRLPEPLHGVIQSLDRVYEIARLEYESEPEDGAAGEEGGSPTLAHIIQLVENYLDRLKKLPEDST
ncbi:MAG: hypothetical protein NXI24_18800 [bacterium]|nr:hypothetical protein [bacterium]